jgi:hypothetical protein
MANNVRIELNRAGVRDLLRSAEIMSACRQAAETVRNNYGKHTELEEYVGQNRVNVAVVAPFEDASNDNSLLKAVHE